MEMGKKMEMVVKYGQAKCPFDEGRRIAAS
jgi:hypothetical protein